MWGRSTHFEHGRPDAEQGPRRKVVLADVEIDVQLIAGQTPAVGGAGHQCSHPGVHHRHLGQAAATALAPAVTDEPLFEVEHPLVELLAVIDCRAADDQLESAEVGGRIADVVEAGIEFGSGQMIGCELIHHISFVALSEVCARNWRREAVRHTGVASNRECAAQGLAPSRLPGSISSGLWAIPRRTRW